MNTNSNKAICDLVSSHHYSTTYTAKLCQVQNVSWIAHCKALSQAQDVSRIAKKMASRKILLTMVFLLLSCTKGTTVIKTFAPISIPTSAFTADVTEQL